MWTLLDLILPLDCAGCGAAGSGWCPACAVTLAGGPVRVPARSGPAAPCWALGGYSGPRRQAVLAAKERGRRDLAEPLGRALAAGLAALREAGELDPPELAPLVLVPAPTRRRAARQRGGDPVARMAAVAARHTRRAAPAVALRAGWTTRDSVGLSAAQREANLAGRVIRRPVPIPPAANVVLVDDVLTTGATAAESIRVLRRSGTPVTAVLAICAASRPTNA
ncbi:ComF family protein [Skermania piniformis]|uniref:ComF family protein n=1 Tax=Skermania pinensis TaxID=39122 RepID=A0ABX8SC41_9ACTN|nr:ComF family protein [Skermania piniformis]QXQ13261.1 ComF family protein [Skermania piniformis]